MDETSYGLRVLLNVPHPEAVVLATDALKAQGFGIVGNNDALAGVAREADERLRRALLSLESASRKETTL
jgi:hypothetical protein